MRRLIFIITILCGLLINESSAKANLRPIFGLGIFRSSLSPYGEWIETNFGIAWRPLRVVYGWRPYLYGRWVWTDYGWYWVSDEPFGWATFHYGRWFYDDYYGWIWIPDDTWGPAWVEWRYDNEYIGWAPLPPFATFRISIGITFTNHWVAPIHYWNFIPCRYFTATRIVDYIQSGDRSRRFFRRTRSIREIRTVNNRIINLGVDVKFIEKRTNKRIRKIEVVQNNKRKRDRLIRTSNRERLEVYHPQVKDNSQREKINGAKRNRIKKQNTGSAGKINRDQRKGQIKDRSLNKQGKNFQSFKRQPKRREHKFRKRLSPSERYNKTPEKRQEYSRNKYPRKNRYFDFFKKRIERKQKKRGGQKDLNHKAKENKQKHHKRIEKRSPQKPEHPRFLQRSDGNLRQRKRRQ